MMDLKAYYKNDIDNIAQREIYAKNNVTKNGANADSAVMLVVEINLGTASEFLVSQSLIEWRHDFADPRPTIGKMMDFSKWAISLLPKLKLEQAAFRKVAVEDLSFHSYQFYNFPAVDLFSFLLNGKVDPAVDEQVPGAEIIRQTRKTVTGFRPLDSALILSLNGNEDELLWKLLLQELENKKNRKLLFNIWKNYYSGLEAIRRGDADALLQVVEQGTQLYESRKTNGFFLACGGYESGRFADYHLDFRLAAILRHAEIKHPGITSGIQTIHQWKW